MAKMKCLACGHDGKIHSDNEYTHTGECFMELEDKKFTYCKCKCFIRGEK